MARRKRTQKKHHRRRHRRIGALSLNPGSDLVTYGSIAVGFIAGGAINPLINSLVPASFKAKASAGKIISVGQAGVGAALLFMKGKKSLPKTLAGGLLLGSGIKRAMTVFKKDTTDTLGGYGDVPVIGAYSTQGQLGRRRVAGYGDVPVIGAYTTPGALNGARVMGSTNPSGSTLMG